LGPEITLLCFFRLFFRAPGIVGNDNFLTPKTRYVVEKGAKLQNPHNFDAKNQFFGRVEKRVPLAFKFLFSFSFSFPFSPY
jgi:hypothetical protein